MTPDQDHRLVRLETEVDFLRAGFTEVKDILKQLAVDMHSLAIADAERHEERREMDRLTSSIDFHEAKIQKLWQRIDDLVSAQADAEKSRLREELKARNRWLWELGKTVLGVIVAMTLYHFGVKAI